MSRDLDIACKDCQEAHWIGQGHFKQTEGSKVDGYIYFGDEKCMALLESFLFTHQGHHLLFGDNEVIQSIHWKEFERS